MASIPWRSLRKQMQISGPPASDVNWNGMDAMIKSWHDGGVAAEWWGTGGGLAMFEMPARMLPANEGTPRISGDLNRFVMPWLDHGIHSVAVVAERDANCRSSCFGCELERHGCHDQVMA
ncbi:hypothetical protein [Pannonibacter sp. TSB10GB1]|uniref:hypothetical protein n=1 Tax=Pannonibacter sp. TSB10GB1 TaxID=2003583 RepID=UPI001648A6A9|nr:hypothetical protein [Pannonibacter sp. TSB10GB1]